MYLLIKGHIINIKTKIIYIKSLKEKKKSIIFSFCVKTINFVRVKFYISTEISFSVKNNDNNKPILDS